MFRPNAPSWATAGLAGRADHGDVEAKNAAPFPTDLIMHLPITHRALRVRMAASRLSVGWLRAPSRPGQWDLLMAASPDGIPAWEASGPRRGAGGRRAPKARSERPYTATNPARLNAAFTRIMNLRGSNGFRM